MPVPVAANKPKTPETWTKVNRKKRSLSLLENGKHTADIIVENNEFIKKMIQIMEALTRRNTKT